jgi:hypothetical protein
MRFCYPGGEYMTDNMLAAIARSAARSVVSANEYASRITLIALRELARRMSLLAGQRNVILVSPGFYITDSLGFEEANTTDRAIRSNVVVSALNARGLDLQGILPDIDKPKVPSPEALRLKAMFAHSEAILDSGTLASLTDGTGGTYIENSNDYAGGFLRLARAPEYRYTLGFAPQNLKLDGSFHSLKVKLASGGKLNVRARPGYWAPKHSDDAEEAAKQEVENAVFSREEIRDFPVDLSTEVEKKEGKGTTLTVLANVDMKQVSFHKADGRNRNELTMVSALFEHNGNFVLGFRKVFQLRLMDATMQKLTAISAVTLKMSFDVQPGSYQVRMVVRDSEGRQLTARNGIVEIL